MSAVDTHRVALKWAVSLLEMVMADATTEQLHWHPPGLANPIAALYAHAVCGLDALLHHVLQGKPPLYAGELAGATGISQPEWHLTRDWARSLTVDLEPARTYARHVYAAFDVYLAGLDDADLEQEMDLSNVGLGLQKLDWILSAIGSAHVNNMAGEISCLKGIQGAQGYPF